MASDEADMLRSMGLRNVEDLFSDIPPAVRMKSLALPPGLPEQEVVSRVTEVLSANRTMADMPTFLGAGLYDHFVPAAVRAITSRSEFYTAYTPYQPEVSQGILQSLWEYQSMICELTGMDAANTSMYDASTALGEAARMARRIHSGKIFLVPRALRWHRRNGLGNYTGGGGIIVKEVEDDRTTGMLDLSDLKHHLTEDVCGVYVENPNFFGRLEEQLAEIRAATDVPLVVGINPIAQSILRKPADFGADIVIGEGQALGNAVNFGGPLLGIFATRQEHLRKMPGRVIGLTKDAEGRRAFCMTLQTREQHIRREKAMSNICTNESLLSVAAAAYMAVLGSNGLRKVAVACMRKAKDLAAAIRAIPGYEAPLFKGPHFNEFTVRYQGGYEAVHQTLLKEAIHGGMAHARHLKELRDFALFAVTERHTKSDLDRLLAALRDVP